MVQTGYVDGGGRDLLTAPPMEVMNSSIVNEVYMGADEDE